MPHPDFQPGEPVPWFFGTGNSSARFAIDTIAGRYLVLTFFGAATDPASQAFFAALASARFLFDDDTASFFGISADPTDVGLLPDQLPGVRYFYDTDLAISQQYGVVDAARNRATYRRQTFVLDERLRVIRVVPWSDPDQHALDILATLRSLPAFAPPSPADPPAPVLVVPRIFEPEFCRTLIDYYDAHGGRESGFMREIEGKTVEILDPNHKRRSDEEIMDESLRRACMVRIHHRLVPEIERAFQFRATRIERYIVACYSDQVAGHFRAHRDNTTKGTMHRRFAVSLNLNTGEYDGGRLWFPEFGRQQYLPPAGGAVVFSCSLLHEATPVTRGKRYAFLPFLYDDAAAKLREQNLKFVEPRK